MHDWRSKAGARQLGGILAVLWLAACGGGGSSGGLASSLDLGPAPWGTLRGNVFNQGRGSVAGPTEGRVTWAADLGAPVEGVVLVDGAGNLRVRPAGSDLYALRPDGSLLWKRNVGPGLSTPVVDRQGSTFVSNTNGNVLKIDRDGVLRWKVFVGGDPGTGLLIDAGRLVFAGSNGTVSVVDNGALDQTLGIGAVMDSVPADMGNGQLFVASTDGNLYELRIDPASKDLSVGEALPLPGPVTHCTPAVASGNIYVVTDDDLLVKAFNDPGKTDDAGVAWTFDPMAGGSDGGRSSPAIGRDLTVYYGTQDGRMLAVDTAGALAWSVDVGAPIRSSVLLDRDDNLYFRSIDGAFHSLTRDGQVRFVRRRSDPITTTLDSSPSLSADGRVLIGTQGGAVLCLGGGPMFAQVGQDATHRGRSGAQGPADAGFVWSVQLAAPLRSSPLVFDDGSVGLHDQNGLLHFLSPQGRVTFTAGLGGFAEHLALGDDLIYATLSDGRLRGYQRTGGVAFTTPLISGGTLTAPTLAADGTLRVAASSGELFWIAADGAITRQVNGPAVTGPPPAVSASDDTIVVAPGGRLVRFDAAGVQSGSFQLPGAAGRSAPVVAGDGRVFVATDRDVLVAVAPDFTGLWTFDPLEAQDTGGRGGPALGPADTVLHVTRSGVLHGRDGSSGARRFELALGAAADEPPVVDLEGRVYVTTVDGRLHIADVAGALQQTVSAASFDGNAFRHGARLIDDQSVVVVSETGRATLLRNAPAWSSFHGTAEHTGRSVKRGPASPPNIAWSVNVGGTLELSPVVAPNGDVLVHTTEGNLVIVSPAGAILDTLPAGAGPGLPLAHPSGLRLVGSKGGVLSAFDASGAAKWFVTLGGTVSGLTLGPDGEILATALGQLHALGATGQRLWSTAAGSNGEGAPAAGADGVLRVANADAELRRFDPDGDPLGTTPLPGAARRTSPLVDASGRTYVVTDADVLVAVDPDGSVPWSFDPGSGTALGGRASPCLAGNGDVVYGAMDGFVYRVSAAGAQVFAFDTGSPVRSAPVLDGQDTVYVGSDGGLLYAIDDGGAEVWSVDPSGGAPAALTSVAFAVDGGLYVGAADGGLYRVE